MEDGVFKDSYDFLIQLRQMRLDIVGWVTKRLARMGITFPQYTVLAVLDELGEATMSRLSAALGTTMGASTNLVDKLVHARYVERERSTKDRRVVNVKVTPEGRGVLKRATDESAKFLAEAFGQVSPEDRKIVIKACTRVVELMDKYGTEGEETSEDPS